MDDTEFQVIAHDKPLRQTVMRHERIGLNMKAQLAKELVHIMMASHHALAIQQGKNVQYDIERVVEAACEASSAMFNAFETRGWATSVPGLDILRGDDQERVGF